MTIENAIIEILNTFAQTLYALPVLIIGSLILLKNKWAGFAINELGIIWISVTVLNFATRQSLLLEESYIRFATAYVVPVTLFLVLTAGTVAFCFPRTLERIMK